MGGNADGDVDGTRPVTNVESRIGTRTVLGIPANKRGALGVTCWLVGALACFTPMGFLLGVPLVCAAAYLLVYSR